MVRHHVKKNKSKKPRLSKEELETQKKEAQAQKDEALNRFAGSSEEEDNSGSDVDDDEESMNGTTPEKQLIQSRNSKKRKKPDQNNEESNNDIEEEKEEDDGYSSAESSSDGHDDDEYDASHREGPMFLSAEAENAIQSPHLVKKTSTQAGMAGAMSRILGGQTASRKSMDSGNVILSKTKTPLQKLQIKEKQRRIEAKETRSDRRSERLTCMHVPLLAATTFQMSGSDKSMSQELELERMHRRVATRGVVALFNAITQHQQSQIEQQLQSKEDVVKAKNKDIQNISKKGFLDMIKSKGVSKEEDGNSSPKKDNQESKQNSKDKSSSSGGWSALKDDFMMNSKLKDWDKDVTSSSEEEGEEE